MRVVAGLGKGHGRRCRDAGADEQLHDRPGPPVSCTRSCPTSRGVHEAGADIVELQPRILAQKRVRRVSSGEHAEDVFDSQAMAPDDRLAAENIRVGGDAREQVVLAFGHDTLIPAPARPAMHRRC